MNETALGSRKPLPGDTRVEESMAFKTDDPAPAVDDIRVDLQTLREDLARLTQQVTEAVGARSEEALNEAKAKGRQAADAAREAADSLAGAVEESLRSRPFTTLVLAVGLGFLFGSTWRR
jgi:ElaB/YqjD/DUF883 family membrane-anchored ribosome-binding protein